MDLLNPTSHGSRLSRRALILVSLIFGVGLFLMLTISPVRMSEGVSNYQQIHLTMELFSASISFLVFGVGWNISRDEKGMGTVLLLALGFLGVGLLDLAHGLSHPGLPDWVTPNTTQKSIVLWLMARGLETVILVSAILMLRLQGTLRLPRWPALVSALFLILLLIWSGVAENGLFPIMFSPETGLTSIKVHAEWLVVILHFVAAALLWTTPRESILDWIDVNSLIAALLIAGMGEVCFTLYRTTGEYYNFIGHIYKMVSYAFIYRAVFVGGIRGPFQSLENARVELMRALRVRDDFLMIASHELRTPMTPLRLQLEMVERQLDKVESDSVSRDTLKEMVSIAERQVGRMTHLIENLLNFARLRSADLEYRHDLLDLGELVGDVCERYRLQADLAGSQIRLSVSSSAVGRWDRVQMEQLFVNLLTNALKYGAGKPVDVTVIPSEAAVQLIVRDYGVGIAPKDHSRIFERFERAAPSVAFAGLGLGLSIAAEVVRLHGGKISVQSEEGKGAEFIVELPRS